MSNAPKAEGPEPREGTNPPPPASSPVREAVDLLESYIVRNRPREHGILCPMSSFAKNRVCRCNWRGENERHLRDVELLNRAKAALLSPEVPASSEAAQGMREAAMELVAIVDGAVDDKDFSSLDSFTTQPLRAALSRSQEGSVASPVASKGPERPPGGHRPAPGESPKAAALEGEGLPEQVLDMCGSCGAKFLHFKDRTACPWCLAWLTPEAPAGDSPAREGGDRG